MIAHCVSVNVMRIKITSHLVSMNSVSTRFGNPQTSTDLSQTEVDEFTKFYRGPLIGTQIPAVGKKPFTKICRSNFSVPVGSV